MGGGFPSLGGHAAPDATTRSAGLGHPVRPAVFAVLSDFNAGAADRQPKPMELATSTCLSHKAAEDYELVRSAVCGDQRAYSNLLERYYPGVHQLMFKMVNNRHDAEDLALEAFGKAFHNLSNYTPHYAFRTWLSRIAVNNCIDYKRKKRARVLSLDEPALSESGADLRNAIPCANPDPEEAFIRHQRSELLHRLSERLPQRHRQMIEMRFFQEKSYDEMAVELNIPLGTVKAQLFRAKELFSELLQKPGASAYLDTSRHKTSKGYS